MAGDRHAVTKLPSPTMRPLPSRLAPEVGLTVEATVDGLSGTTVSSRKDSGNGRRERLSLGAWQGYLDQFAVIDHPQAEAVVVLVADEDLNGMRIRPCQRLQMAQQPTPVVADELDDPRVTLLGRHARPIEHAVVHMCEALVPVPGFIGTSERFHDLFSSSRQDDALCVSTHQPMMTVARRSVTKG